MGTWGPRNFENDTAGELLHALTSSLIAQIEEAVADPECLEPDQYEAVAVVCHVEILAALAEGLRHEGGAAFDLPTPDAVEGWREATLAVWDAHIDALNPTPEHKVQRRAVIVESFDRLARAADAQA